MKSIAATLGVIVAALTFGVNPASAQRSEMTAWTVDGELREAILYAPPVRPGQRLPLVFSFHGHNEEIQNFQRTGLHRAWPDAIVVYPQGLLSLHDGLPGWQMEKGEDHDRDLRMVDVALAALRRKYPVDEARIYATGFSEGANFTYLLWAERPAVFAAYAPVAGRFKPLVQPKQPKPVLQIAGTEDLTIPFTDQQKAIATARRIDHAEDAGAPCGSGCTVYGASRATPVMTWIHPGGHEYPAGAAERIAAFFRERVRKP